MFRSGYVNVGRIRGIPIRLHWSIPLGALVFGRFQLVPGFWLGFFLLVLIHETGHALLVRRYRLHVEAVEVHGLGGQCRYSGHPTPVERSVIAWGGVLAQGVLLLLTVAMVWLLGSPTSAFGAELVHAFTMTNLILAGINLLPIPPLDGAEAWKLLSLWRDRRYQKRRDAVRREKAAARRGDPQSADDVNESVRDALRRAAKEAARGRRRRERS